MIVEYDGISCEVYAIYFTELGDHFLINQTQADKPHVRGIIAVRSTMVEIIDSQLSSNFCYINSSELSAGIYHKAFKHFTAAEFDDLMDYDINPYNKLCALVKQAAG